MAVTDFFIGEIATELVKQLLTISARACMCKTSADHIVAMINSLLPTIQEIKFSGVELPPHRQRQLDNFSEILKRGLEISNKVIKAGRWNVMRKMYLTRKMEKVERQISQFLSGPLLTHTLADVHHLRFDSESGFNRMDKGFDRVDKGFDRVDKRLDGFCRQLASMKIGGGGLIRETMERAEMELEMEDNLVLGLEVGKGKVKEMMFSSNGEGGIVGITGMGGSGKTTLAKELDRDVEVRDYFNNKILFLTVSKSPNVEELRLHIRQFLSGYTAMDSFPTNSLECNFQYQLGAETPALVILDDVWTQEVLDQLTCRIPGCTTLVVSRSKFTVASATYKVEFLRGDEAMSLFCVSAFGQKSIPPGFCENLVKEIVDECKGLPLALKVIGASLKGRPEKYWEGVRTRLARGEPAGETHESRVLQQIASSVESLPLKNQKCFLDLGSFPEDKKIPLDILINMWVEIHDLEESDAFAVLIDLSDKNLLTLVKDPRLGTLYASYYDIFVTQHDVLRDLALHLSNCGEVNERRRLLMPKRDAGLPREWERNNDQPYNAQIVSIHTGEMNEMEWFDMEFPRAEVLILNFSSHTYFLPPFINKMPKLRSLVIINNGMTPAFLLDFSVFSNLTNLRSLWLERVHAPELSNTTVPLRNLRKMSLILCKINDSLDPTGVDIAQIFPRLSDLTIDHCDDLVELPPSICNMTSLNSLSITNCHRLCELPKNLSKLQALELLRLFACPELKNMPAEICDLPYLKYLDISQCVSLTYLPEEIGNLKRLEKIDMRDCLISSIPSSAVSLKSLRYVICDKESSWMWSNVENALQGLRVEAAEKCYSLDWLDE